MDNNKEQTIRGKVISIIGFRSVRIDNVNSFLKKIKETLYPVPVQIVDAMKIAGKLHLVIAFLNTQKSFEEGREISENLEMEILLYAAGTRQISKAIEILGIKPQTTNIAAIIFTSNLKEIEESEEKLLKLFSGIRDDSVLEITNQDKIETLMKTFSVTKLEIDAMTRPETIVSDLLTWLIVERVSLLSIKH
ncbi:MAG: KEOPS complex subunit Cgi121 [Candidatus Bathyarchaeota archaeon]